MNFCLSNMFYLAGVIYYLCVIISVVPNSRNKEENDEDLNGGRKPLSNSRNKEERISPGVVTKILLYDKINGTNLDDSLA